MKIRLVSVPDVCNHFFTYYVYVDENKSFYMKCAPGCKAEDLVARMVKDFGHFEEEDLFIKYIKKDLEKYER